MFSGGTRSLDDIKLHLTRAALLHSLVPAIFSRSVLEDQHWLHGSLDEASGAVTLRSTEPSRCKPPGIRSGGVGAPLALLLTALRTWEGEPSPRPGAPRCRDRLCHPAGAVPLNTAGRPRREPTEVTALRREIGVLRRVRPSRRWIRPSTTASLATSPSLPLFLWTGVLWSIIWKCQSAGAGA